MTIAATRPVRQRKNFRLQREGFPQSWYAVALAQEVIPGKILGKDLCDGRVILYRDGAGKPHALSSRCKHMGADLTLGDVVGDAVRCPFHHWQYGPDGICNRLATRDKIPPQARLVAFPTAEAWGLVWVFWGLEPLFEVPSFHPAVDTSRMVWKAFEIELKQKLFIDPWFMGVNAFDHQHLIALHGLPEHEAGYERVQWNRYTIDRGGLIHYGFGGSSSRGEANLLGLSRQTAYLSGSAPMGRDGNRIFMVEAASLGDGSAGDRAKAEMLVEDMHLHHNRVINQDVDVLNSLDPTEPGLLVQSDWGVTRYLKWAADYPTITMADLVQQAEARGLSAGGR